MTVNNGEKNGIQIEEKGTMPNLADRSKEIRTQLGLSQNDVAKALHVTRGFISNVENGRVNMSMRLMVYYARLMHVSLDEIAGLTDKQYLSFGMLLLDSIGYGHGWEDVASRTTAADYHS